MDTTYCTLRLFGRSPVPIGAAGITESAALELFESGKLAGQCVVLVRATDRRSLQLIDSARIDLDDLKLDPLYIGPIWESLRRYGALVPVPSYGEPLEVN